ENPLVWRIVTRGGAAKPRPLNPFTDMLPPRRDGPVPFFLQTEGLPPLNRSTRLHAPPLYAPLLVGSRDTCRVIIRAGGRLPAAEEHAPAAAATLRVVFERDPDLRARYLKGS